MRTELQLLLEPDNSLINGVSKPNSVNQTPIPGPSRTPIELLLLKLDRLCVQLNMLTCVYFFYFNSHRWIAPARGEIESDKERDKEMEMDREREREGEGERERERESERERERER